MSKIMKRPDWLDEAGSRQRVSYYTGLKVRSKFYNRNLGYGSLKVDNIPEELKNNKWIPDDGKTYKCWWFYTNPSDPEDPGEDILTYIEEVEDEVVKDMRGEIMMNINQKISKLSLERLRDLEKYLNKYYL